MVVSIEQFTRQVVDSGLMSADAIASVVDASPDDKRPRDGVQLARVLVRQEKLTVYQARQIYAGKGESLILGNYVILDKLGQGGMGLVLKAEHQRMKRIVALKVLSPHLTRTPDAVRRFLREVEAAAKLTHTNIVIAHDADEASGTHFLVMEYVEGNDLSSVVEEHGPLPLERALDCILQAARGLAYAHERGVVHRDIKPANLLLDKQGVIKILDMGLARLETAGEQQDQLTGTGQIMGTVDFMAPEQAVNTKHADARADIYSLGVTLWYLLTGRRLFEGETVVEKLMAHQTQPIPSLQSACPQSPLALEAVFTRMVAKTPQSRYQTVVELIHDLERCRSEAQQEAQLAATAGDVAAMEVAKVGRSPRTSLVAGPTPAFPETQISKAPPISSPSTELDDTLKSSAPLVETDPKAERSVSVAPIALATLTTGSRRWWQDRRVQIALGSGALLLLILGVWILVRDKDGREVARVEVPEGGSVTVETAAGGEKVNAPPQLPTAAPAPAVAPFDARKASEHQQAWARYLGVSVDMTNSIGMKFMLIPPGEFDMGSSPEEIARDSEQAKREKEPDWIIECIGLESPRHRVKITKPFYLGTYPVTQAEYEKLMGINPSACAARQVDASALGFPLDELGPRRAKDTKSELDGRRLCAKVMAGRDTSHHPVDTVSSHDAVEYCRRMSAIQSEEANGRVYRLPTEAEWEYACRAGTTSRWFFGDDPADLHAYAWYSENSGGMTHPVGQRQPNPWRLHDMIGNAAQWCNDYYALTGNYYEQSPREDPQGPDLDLSTETGEMQYNRINRGGTTAITCRSTFRTTTWHKSHGAGRGFRVAVGIAAKP